MTNPSVSLTIDLEPNHTHMRMKFYDNRIDPRRSIEMAIDSLQRELKDFENCPYHSMVANATGDQPKDDSDDLSETYVLYKTKYVSGLDLLSSYYDKEVFWGAGGELVCLKDAARYTQDQRNRLGPEPEFTWALFPSDYEIEGDDQEDLFVARVVGKNDAYGTVYVGYDGVERPLADAMIYEQSDVADMVITTNTIWETLPKYPASERRYIVIAIRKSGSFKVPEYLIGPNKWTSNMNEATTYTDAVGTSPDAMCIQLPIRLI